MGFNIWHYSPETLPRIIESGQPDAKKYDLYIPVGIYPFTQDKVNITMEFTIDGGSLNRIGFNRNNTRGYVTSLTAEYLSCLKINSPENTRYYFGMEKKIADKDNLYYEGLIKDIPEGSFIEYRIAVTPRVGLPQYTDRYRLYIVKPEFKFEDIRFMTTGDDTAENTNVLYYKEDSEFHHFRADYNEILPKVFYDFNLSAGQLVFSLSNVVNTPWLPFINPFHDYLVLSVPKAKAPGISSINWKNENIDLSVQKNVGKARIMFIHYCMQGLNDLFEKPNKNYAPYRTYAQVTMRDELASYSSRPGSNEGREEDGYAFTLDYHRKYGVKYLWTFNGGVLALIAHDCPDELKQIREDIKNGLLDPTIAGFGGHRLPYYQEETNRYSIQYGIDMMKNVLGKCNKVYYLDQRLYKQLPNIHRALKNTGVEYVVVDASTGFYPHKNSMTPNNSSNLMFLDHQYLWQDEKTGLYILYIDDESRGKMLWSSPSEYKMGKLNIDLRKKFMYFASHSSIRGKNLIIYSDDADKASGNGWFDGDYSGGEPEFTDMFRASLEWIAAHPWIEAVTSEDLDPAKDCVGTIDMKDAICPSVDPGGSTTTDTYGKQLHFDAWYDNWKKFRSRWLDRSFEELSQDVEFTILNWPATYQNQLFELGKMNFSMYLHESQWNKQPLEGASPNERSDVTEPEDFVIAATLQLRNAQVYLNASVWGEWAKSYSGNEVFINSGPVIDTLAAMKIDPSGKGTHWDRDLLENVVMYNKKLLLVMDQNGGRITHIFVMKNNSPYCVSGTMKTYQFLSGDNLLCDGEVLQNTVYTPNHAYVACDVNQARLSGTIGKKTDRRKYPYPELDWYYPDNFNLYKYMVTPGNQVIWLYEKTMETIPLNDSSFANLLEQDRNAKNAGLPGIVFHPLEGFKKEIELDQNSIRINYYGVGSGHTVSNEFTLDLFKSIMFGQGNMRKQLSPKAIEISNVDGLKVTVNLKDNCRFNEDTLETEGIKNLRLRRVMTDCLEIEPESSGDFSYSIDFS